MDDTETLQGHLEVQLDAGPVEVVYSGSWRIAPPFREQDLVEWRAVAHAAGREFRMGSTLICTLPRDADRKIATAPAQAVIVRLIERSVARRVTTELQRAAAGAA